MAITGIILRRNTKEYLINNPPVIGEIVFAIDTEEYGALENNILIWRKHITALKYLTDTSISNETSGDLLKYDGTEWKNTGTIDLGSF